MFLISVFYTVVGCQKDILSVCSHKLTFGNRDMVLPCIEVKEVASQEVVRLGMFLK